MIPTPLVAGRACVAPTVARPDHCPRHERCAGEPSHMCLNLDTRSTIFEAPLLEHLAEGLAVHVIL